MAYLGQKLFVMNKKKFSEFTNQELHIEKKKLKNKKIVNALLIGFLAGIFFVGAAAAIYKKNVLGIIPMLIPIFLIYRLINNSKQDKELEQVLKERDIK